MNAHRPYGLAAYVARDGVVCKDQVLEVARRPPPELRFPPTPTAPPPPPPMTVEHLPGDDDGANGEDDPGHGGGELELTAPADWSTAGHDTAGQDTATAFAASGVDDSHAAARSPSSAEPFNSVLILIPLRLGLQTLNEIYDGAIKVGMHGDRHGGARRAHVCASPGFVLRRASGFRNALELRAGGPTRRCGSPATMVRGRGPFPPGALASPPR